MRLLFDENLPEALVEALSNDFPESIHYVWIAVFDVGFVQRLKASKWFPACDWMTVM